MKKAILPVMISALLATSAQAANLYEADGTTVALSGEVDAVFSTTESDDSSIYSWANAQLDISTKVSDSVTAMASFEIEATDGEEVLVDDAYIGFAGDFGTIKLGETGSSYAILEKAEVGNEISDYDVDYDDSETLGKAVRFQKTIGDVALSANYSFVDGEGDDDFAVSADYGVDGFTIGAAYINEGDDQSAMGISASFETDVLYVAATYTLNEEADDSEDATAAFSASYAVADATTVYGSYQINDGDNTDLTNYYVGVSYDVTSNIYAFVEYNNDDEADAGYAGFYYSF